MQRTASAAGRLKPVVIHKSTDRFGDEPPRQPPKIRPRMGGAAPWESTNGFLAPPQGSVGTMACPVEKWDHVHRRVVPLKPKKHNGMAPDAGGPAHYTPEALCRVQTSGLAPNKRCVRITGKYQDLDPSGRSLDLMYTLPPALGKQPTAARRTEPVAVMRTSEKLSSATITVTPIERAAELRSKVRAAPAVPSPDFFSSLCVCVTDMNSPPVPTQVKRGISLDKEERAELMSFARTEPLAENGSLSYNSYIAASPFDGRGSSRGSLGPAQGSVAFGTTRSLHRFNRFERRTAFEAQRAERAAKSMAPLYGGRKGAAYRPDKDFPGPTTYDKDVAFTGTGRLQLSKSSPAFSIVSKISFTQLTGGSEKKPDPGAYFQEPKIVYPHQKSQGPE